MNKTLFGIVIAIVMLLTGIETVSGEVLSEPLFKKPLLFRKAKAYQRALLKQELKTELYAELGEKLEGDVDVAANEIREATEMQVAQESKKLQNQAAGHARRLSQANTNFQKQVVADTTQFKNELVTANTEFQQKLTQADRKARQRLATATKKANEQLAAFNKAQSQANEKMIADLVAATGKSLSQEVGALGKKLAADNQLAVKTGIDSATKTLLARIDDKMATAVASLVAQSKEQKPAPEPAPVPEEQSAAQLEPTVPKDDDTE